MRIKTGAMCRGDGVAYIEIIVKEKRKNTLLRVKAFSEDNTSLPAEIYRISESGTEYKQFKKGSYLIATPLLDTKKVFFEVEEFSPDGERFGSESFHLMRDRIKWSSRLLYKSNWEKASKLRNFERSIYKNQIHISPDFFTRKGDENGVEIILKGIISYPGKLDEIPQPLLLDSLGHTIKNPNIIMGRPRIAYVFGTTRTEASYTLRIPDDGCTYCLYVPRRELDRSAFLCLSKDMRIILSEVANPDLYQISGKKKYADYIRREEASIFIPSSESSGNEGPKFSIVVPLYKTPLNFFHEMVDSVLKQSYDNWELVLVNASLEDEELQNAIDKLSDERIKTITLEKNLGIAENTNKGILASTGDYICYFDHDDTLSSHALREYAQAIKNNPDTAVLYCDEDLLEKGKRTNPHFKSDFNIDLLRCHNYITHFLTVRADLAKENLLRHEHDGAQDYDLVLRLSEITDQFVHVPKVLYHWRMHGNSTAANPASKTYAIEAGRSALEQHLERSGLKGTVTNEKAPFIYRVKYDLIEEPLVSIIIPNKDNTDVLNTCIESIEKLSTYSNYEIIVVENNSTEDETFAYYKEVQKQYENIKVIIWDGIFNYAAINNFAVEYSNGKYLLFLNNDTEVITPNWIEEMLSFCQREDVGAVGVKLLYPDNTIQHAGVFISASLNSASAGGPGHVFMHLDRSAGGYAGRAMMTNDLSAVTAACIMVKRSVFNEIEGFDERFVVAYNDVDLCLKIRDKGYLVVYDPHVELYHYESLSRDLDNSSSESATYARFIRENGLLRYKWSEYFAKGDPYHGIYATM